MIKGIPDLELLFSPFQNLYVQNTWYAEQVVLTETHVSYLDASAHVELISKMRCVTGKVTADPLECKIYVGKSSLSSYLEYPAPKVRAKQIFVKRINK